MDAPIPPQETQQPTQETVQAPVSNKQSFKNPNVNKTSIRKFFNLFSWVFLFFFLPITVLIFLSQDSLPGDVFYPVKRGMENVILAAASVHPATRASFRTDLTEARFKEAQNLVVSKSNATALSTFIDEVESAQNDVAKLTNDEERSKAEEKLITKINEYQNGLSTLQAKTEQNIIAYNPKTPTSNQESQAIQNEQSPTPQPTSPSQGGPSRQSFLSPTATAMSSQTPQVFSQIKTSPAIKSTPTPTPTPIPKPSVHILSSPSPVETLVLTPTPTPTPISTVTIVPTITLTTPTAPVESPEVLEQKKIVHTIKETKVTLAKIKKELEEKKEEKRDEKEPKDEKSEAEKPDKQKHQTINPSVKP